MATPIQIQLSYVDYEGALQVIECDAFLSEHHQLAAKATQFPVETGALISDHVIQEADQVRLEVLGSDTPMPSRFSMSREDFDLQSADPGRYRESMEVPGRASDLFLMLRMLKEDATPVLLTSTVHVYDNMIIEAIDLPVSAGTGDAVLLTLSLRHVRRVGLKTVPVPQIEKADPKKSKGRQPTVPADSRLDSAAKAMFDPSKKP